MWLQIAAIYGYDSIDLELQRLYERERVAARQAASVVESVIKQWEESEWHN